MFPAPKSTTDSKSETSANPCHLTLDQKKQLGELKLTKEKLSKEKIELEQRLKQISQQLSATTKKLNEFTRKPDVELEALLKKKIVAFHCHANLEKQVIAIDLYQVEDLEAVKKAFHSFVNPKSMKISDQPLDGTGMIAGSAAFLEIDMKERANLIKGLQLAQTELDIPTTRWIMKC